MSAGRSVIVSIALDIRPDGLVHWYVTTSEELQTIQWADDGTVTDKFDAIDKAVEIARMELRHVALGGSVEMTS